MRSVHHDLAGRRRRGRAARPGRRASARTTTSTASSSSCRCRDQIDPDAVVAALDPGKDVDGLTPLNAGLLAHGTPGLVPCTPAGVIELLRHEGVELEGAEAVVVGRSKLVGVPVARLLLSAERDGHRLPLAHARSGRRLPPRRRPRRRGRRSRTARRRRRQARRGGHRRRHEPRRGRPLRRRRLRGRRRGRRGDHAGPRRGRPDDDRDASRQHARCRPGAGVVSRAIRRFPGGERMIERPTPGEQVAGIAGLALILTMFLFAWYGVNVPGVNGFDAFDAFERLDQHHPRLRGLRRNGAGPVRQRHPSARRSRSASSPRCSPASARWSCSSTSSARRGCPPSAKPRSKST